MVKKLVIVESPSKVKAISKYLGTGYEVVASNGHVRNISARQGAVEPENNFFIWYEVPEKSKKQIKVIENAIKKHKCDVIYIATDPDREGEAIGWHIMSLLKQDKVFVRDALRISFNEITRDAVCNAMKKPRQIDLSLVDAQQARSALDYLIGFNISPILWRKLPGSRSAGRVQSVALRMVCDREQEIEQFVPQEYWTIYGNFQTNRNTKFVTQLIACGGKKLEKFDINNAEQAETIVADMKKKAYGITDIKKQIVQRNPAPPFITSTLQQEASRRLNFSPSRTMRAAQKLYEGINVDGETVGLITYMRTDGVYMSSEAIDSIRQYLGKQIGAEYVPAEKREYKKKIKNAQEAHEAIRPTDVYRTPQLLELEGDEKELYELIWRRAVASQTESAKYNRVTVTIDSDDKKYTLRVTGSKLVFDGFLRIMKQAEDDTEIIDINNDDQITATDFNGKQSFTEPPPRYTDAGLIANLEELGIGRPSTYASIINVLQDRKYVESKNRTFYPSTRGRVVVAFLKSFFAKYVEYDFTANLENELDLVSNGEMEWHELLRTFWNNFEPNVNSVMQKKQDDIMEVLGKYADYMIPKVVFDKCPQCTEGHMKFKISRHGPYLCCSRYPECNYSRAINGDGDAGGTVRYPRYLGVDPETGKEISVRNGPYGFYIQIGEQDDTQPKKGANKNTAPKPRRIPIPKNFSPDTIDLDTSLKLASLPLTLGTHPETKLPIKVGLGKYGPYIFYMDKFISISAKYDFLNITMSDALEIISKSRKLKATTANEDKKPRAKSQKTNKAKT